MATFAASSLTLRALLKTAVGRVGMGVRGARVSGLTPPAKAMFAAAAAARDRVLLPFPSHEIDPYRGLAPHMDIASARARALHALNGGTARIVIASAAGLLPRMSA